MYKRQRYGADEVLADEGLDPAARDAKMRAQAAAWADRFDAHSLLILRKAADRFDTTGRFDRIRAKVLYVIARTDVLFPPSLEKTVMPMLKAAGIGCPLFLMQSGDGRLTGECRCARRLLHTTSPSSAADWSALRWPCRWRRSGCASRWSKP